MFTACSPAPQQPPDASPPEPVASAPDPAEIIRPLYQRYMSPAAATTFPALEKQAPWSDELKAQLTAMQARSEAQQEPILDFDPFIDAQDWQISDVVVGVDGMVENSHAVVRVSFSNFGQRTEILYDLIWQNGEWRVDNMRGATWDLRQIIAA